jgi:hypothetical protein
MLSLQCSLFQQGLFSTCRPSNKHMLIERRGRVVDTTTSYSGGPGFKSVRRPAFLTEGFRGFPQSPENAGIVPKY